MDFTIETKKLHTIDDKRLQEIDNIVHESINNRGGNDYVRNSHSDMLIKASAGDTQAKAYVKTLISQEVIKLQIKDPVLIEEITDYIYANNWGLGPIEKYDIEEVDEIMVHGTKIIIQKKGRKLAVRDKFRDYSHAMDVIRRCTEFDKTIDVNEKNCVALTKRKDGSRVTVVTPRVGKMPYLNLRKFDSFFPSTENMIATNTITKGMVDELEALVKGRANIYVVGEMGSGKTTFLKWLLGFIPNRLVVGTLETTFELYLDELYPDKHFVQLEEQHDYPMGDLFAIMLRQNVDIMLVGECRSYEANELVKAMGRGHSGSIGTGHSMDAMGGIDDLADMIMESGKAMDLRALKYRIARAIDIIIKFRKLPNDERRCAGIYEIVTESDRLEYKVVPIWEFVIDEENPSDKGEHVKMACISDKLKRKLNEYGLKKSEIDRVFSGRADGDGVGEGRDNEVDAEVGGE